MALRAHRLRRAIGTAVTVVLALLAFADAPAQLRTWKQWIADFNSWLGIDWNVFFSGNGGRWVFLLAAVLVGLYSWDVPEKLGLVRSKAKPRVFIAPPLESTTTVEVAQQPPSDVKPGAPERVFTPRSIKELTEIIQSDQIESRKEVLLQPHIGKWLHVEGEIDDITAKHKRPMVSLYIGDQRCYLHFEPTVRDTLLLLDRGDKIRAIGRIDELTRAWISFDDCELLGYEAHSPTSP